MEQKEVMHYYLGCHFPSNWKVSKLNHKPILRRYKDMNSDDAIAMYDFFFTDKHDMGRQFKINSMMLHLPFSEREDVSDVAITPKFMHYLLQKGFDMFGLIESGQAIDKTTLT
jgi:hypothetical protein